SFPSSIKIGQERFIRQFIFLIRKMFGLPSEEIASRQPYTLQRGFVEKIFHSRAYSVRLIRNCRLFIWRKMYDNVRAVIFNIIGDDKCGYIFKKKVDCD